MDRGVISGNMVGSVVEMVNMHSPLQQQHQHQQHLHQHQNFIAPHQHHSQEIVPLPVSLHMGGGNESEQSADLFEFKGSSRNLMNYNKGKACASDEDEPSFTEDGIDGHQNGGNDKKNPPWPRMKWTDDTVRLLIKVVCYVDEDPVFESTNENRKKSSILLKKGKWKSVSKLMIQEGFSVSPQQCEDKFNDLNKRYKRLNDVLGRGMSYKVVKNPALLDSINHLPEKTKEDVRKILCSKHLFFEEIYNYHTVNRLHIAADLGMQSSTPKSRDDHEAWGAMKDENGGDDEDDEESENNDEVGEDNYDENDRDAGAEGIGSFPKRMKLSKDPEGASYWTVDNLHECMRSTAPENLNPVMSGMLPDNARTARIQPDSARTAWVQRQWTRIRKLQVEEQKVDLQAQAFELEKERFKWQKISSKKNRELERLKLENEKMKLENEHMALQLKQKELEIEFNRSEAAMTPHAPILERFQGREQT